MTPVQGLAETYSLFDALPEAAKEEVTELLAEVTSEVHNLQVRLAPNGTGATRAALTWQDLLDGLKVRIGLFGLKGRGAPWYARIIETGRRAQVVMVQRRKIGTRLNGLRNRRKRAEDIATVYALRVRPREGRPFVRIDDQADRIVAQRLAEFWSGVFKKTGAAA